MVRTECQVMEFGLYSADFLAKNVFKMFKKCKMAEKQRGLGKGQRLIEKLLQ